MSSEVGSSDEGSPSEKASSESGSQTHENFGRDNLDTDPTILFSAEDLYADYLRCVEEGDGYIFSTWVQLFPKQKDELVAIHETTRALGSNGRKNPAPKFIGRAHERYELRSMIGRGGMSTVYEAFDRDFDRVVAMKISDQRTQIDVRALHAETVLTAGLEHPSIVPIYDSGADALGRTYFTMRLIDGQSLSKSLRGEALDGQRLRRVVRTLIKACEAIAFAHHRKVIHHDLKPSNIMVGAFGEVYVVDWGLATTLAKRPNGRDTGVLGTPGYVAPEVLDGGSTPKPSTDIYSLGAILYQALTGRIPHVEDSSEAPTAILERAQDNPPTPASQVCKTAPSALVAICERAMERDPIDRYRDVEAFAADLVAWSSDEKVSAFRPSLWDRTRRWMRRNPFAAGLVLATTGALIYGQYAMKEIGGEFARGLAIDSAQLKAQMLDRVQRSYTCYVAARLDSTQLTHDFREKPGTVPIPSTFLKELTLDISKSKDSGIEVAQFSDYPFAFRKSDPLDVFQSSALRELRKHPERSVSKITRRDGQEFARVAVARVMNKTCCDCHNSHPQSPKLDWEPGDVRGALEVIQAVDMHPEDRQATIRGHLWFVGGLMITLWGISALMAGRGRRRAARVAEG